jgi:hypothetical protein
MVEQKKLVRKAEPPTKRSIRWPRWTGFRGRTVWDWLELLSALAVPIVVVVVGAIFSAQQNANFAFHDFCELRHNGVLRSSPSKLQISPIWVMRPPP